MNFRRYEEIREDIRQSMRDDLQRRSGVAQPPPPLPTPAAEVVRRKAELRASRKYWEQSGSDRGKV